MASALSDLHIYIQPMLEQDGLHRLWPQSKCSAFFDLTSYLILSKGYQLHNTNNAQSTQIYTFIHGTHLGYVLFIQQYVPCGKVSVDETLLGEVVHSISYLPTELQQLIWQFFTP